MADPDSRRGSTYATAEVLAWVNTTHAAHDAALARAFGSPERHGMPPIQVGPSEGKLLGLLARLVGARRAVEVGTLAGYSAIHLARALGEHGHLWSCEYSPDHARVARDNLDAAGLGDRVEILVGAARETLPSIERHGPFDLVFIDADKGNYDHYGRWAAAHLRPGGLLLGDNAYFFGRLTAEVDPDAAAMRQFHQEAAAHFDTVCIPTPDGLLLGIRR